MTAARGPGRRLSIAGIACDIFGFPGGSRERPQPESDDLYRYAFLVLHVDQVADDVKRMERDRQQNAERQLQGQPTCCRAEVAADEVVIFEQRERADIASAYSTRSSSSPSRSRTFSRKSGSSWHGFHFVRPISQ
jgi:hypothetical protein